MEEIQNIIEKDNIKDILNKNLTDFAFSSFGREAEVKFTDNTRGKGNFYTIQPYEFDIALKNYEQNQELGSSDKQKLKVINFKDYVYVVINNIENPPYLSQKQEQQLNQYQKNKQKKMKTDSEISKGQVPKEKQLKKWDEGDTDNNANFDLGEDNDKQQWDQFAVNEKILQQKLEFKEEDYTTALKHEEISEELRKKADYLQQELNNGSNQELNRHILEERGYLQQTEDNDEEGLYSAVQGSGRYQDKSKNQKPLTEEEKKSISDQIKYEKKGFVNSKREQVKPNSDQDQSQQQINDQQYNSPSSSQNSQQQQQFSSSNDNLAQQLSAGGKDKKKKTLNLKSQNFSFSNQANAENSLKSAEFKPQDLQGLQIQQSQSFEFQQPKQMQITSPQIQQQQQQQVIQKEIINEQQQQQFLLTQQQQQQKQLSFPSVKDLSQNQPIQKPFPNIPNNTNQQVNLQISQQQQLQQPQQTFQINQQQQQQIQQQQQPKLSQNIIPSQVQQPVQKSEEVKEIVAPSGKQGVYIKDLGTQGFQIKLIDKDAHKAKKEFMHSCQDNWENPIFYYDDKKLNLNWKLNQKAYIVKQKSSQLLSKDDPPPNLPPQQLQTQIPQLIQQQQTLQQLNYIPVNQGYAPPYQPQQNMYQYQDQYQYMPNMQMQQPQYYQQQQYNQYYPQGGNMKY